MITDTPGFQNLIHDSQSTFKVLLDALSRPGKICQITIEVSPSAGLNIACAAACLTLFDLETQVWLQPELDEGAKDWLLFHTGCRFTEDTSQADFAVIWNLDNMPDLAQFKQGSPVCPEDSTTLLIQVVTFDLSLVFSSKERGYEARTLTGAGIDEQITMPINLPDTFWQQWQQNHDSYPLGIDIYFFSNNEVVGLPRTSCQLN